MTEEQAAGPPRLHQEREATLSSPEATAARTPLTSFVFEPDYERKCFKKKKKKEKQTKTFFKKKKCDKELSLKSFLG